MFSMLFNTKHVHLYLKRTKLCHSQLATPTLSLTPTIKYNNKVYNTQISMTHRKMHENFIQTNGHFRGDFSSLPGEPPGKLGGSARPQGVRP